MKKAAFFALLFMVGLGQSGELISHTLSLDLSENGNAVVVERYLMDLKDSTEQIKINDLTVLGKSDIMPWKEVLPEIGYSVNGERKGVRISTEITPSVGTTIVVQYEIDALAKVSAQEPRATVRSIVSEDFTFYDSGQSIFTIPKKSTLNIKLQPSKRLEGVETIPSANSETVESAKVVKGMVTGGKLVYTWKTISSPNFRFDYRIEKNIGQSFEPQKILEGAIYFFMNEPIYASIAALVLAIFVLYRRQISSIMTESFSEEEEIIPPKREI